MTAALAGEPVRLLMTADAVGGVWTYALDLIDGLAAYGVATTLAVLGPAPAPDQVAQAASVPGLGLRITGLPLDWLAAGPDQVLEAGEAIARLALAAGADLVHLNTPALAAGGAFDHPVVAVCHSCVLTWWTQAGHGNPPPAFAWQSDLVARGYAAADVLVAPTQAFAEATGRGYRLPRLPDVVHNGRRVGRAAAVDKRGDFIFTAGRLWDAGKNVSALDRAAARLPWPVLAAGAIVGPDGSQMDLPHIRLVGRLDETGLARHLAARPVFASLARYEPFGLAVLEAAQAGCALVLADIPTYRELWDGAALFVPADDDTAASTALLQIMREPALRDRLGGSAAARAGRYTAAAMAAGMAALYRPLLARSRRAVA